MNSEVKAEKDKSIQEEIPIRRRLMPETGWVVQRIGTIRTMRFRKRSLWMKSRQWAIRRLICFCALQRLWAMPCIDEERRQAEL